LNVAFTSSGSIDPDGTIVSYAWDFGDGGTSTEANPSHTYTAPGSYVTTLTVTDDADGTSSATVAIEAVANQVPHAAAEASPLTVREGGSVEFSSAGSTDPDGAIVSHLWDFGDGETSSAANPSHRYEAPGTYHVSLTVTDDDGATATDQDAVVITVVANQAPVAALNATPQTGARPLVVAFSASASADPDGTIVSYEWDFGDGGTSTEADPSHTYTDDGSYTAVVTVSDDNGATDTDSVVIAVVIDDDGDGFSPPEDCNDAAPLTHPGATDQLGDDIDQDCDGVDGLVTANLYVRTTGADTATCGDIAEPCASISFAIERGQQTDKTQLVVAGGSYGRFDVVSGISVRGGFSQKFRRSQGTTATIVRGNFDPAKGASTGILAEDITAEPTTIADLSVVGADESANARASYGAIIRRSDAALTFDTVYFSGGQGGHGAPGADGTSAAQEPARKGGAGQDARADESSCSTVRLSGGTPAPGGGYGGAGGAKDTDCNGWPDLHATPGYAGASVPQPFWNCGPGGLGGSGGAGGAVGEDGQVGVIGCTRDGRGAGAGLAGPGAFDAATGLWIPSGGTGPDGTLGEDGGGGGGGGGGGAYSNVLGGSGGGGGEGGVRAPSAGRGGSLGYAAIGLLVDTTSVTLRNVSIYAGRGGDGGAGGSGGLGQPGGPGGSGGAGMGGAGAGGNGGEGGRGGNAGAGGGGAGGPAIGFVVRRSYGSFNIYFMGGAPGNGGPGGTIGVPGQRGQQGWFESSQTLP
jgi:PKD repeat protein